MEQQPLAQLQAALRDIERGARLERLDGVLVQRALQHPVRQPSAEAEPPAGDAYRALLALRRRKRAAVEPTNQQDARPRPTDAPRPLLVESAPTAPEAFAALRIDDDDDVRRADAAAKRAVRERDKQLARSQAQAQRAASQLQTLLAQSEALLPSRFLFERNLAALCQERSLEGVRGALLRFQHRFFRLAFARWRAAALELRRAAHERAAAEIARVFRGHRGRTLARQLHRQLAERRRHAEQLRDFRARFRQLQALRIQMLWRRSVRRRAVLERQQRRESAVFLQRRFRDRRLRQNRFVHALLHAREIRAAIAIQKLVRGRRARRRVRAERRTQQRERLVAASLARSASSEALRRWQLERQGAAFLICMRAVFPFAARRRLQALARQARRQRAAQLIARRVGRWFGVRERRADTQARKWLALLAVEQRRTRAAALVIQSHLRRWVQQRKFAMTRMRARKLARTQRLAAKAALLIASSSPSKKATAAPPPPTLALALKGLRLRDSSKQQAREGRDAAAAVRIQRCFRRHTRRVRLLRRHWRDEAVRVDGRVRRRREAAVAIQRRVRGRQARQLVRLRRAERRLRAFVIACKWRAVATLAHAARRICRWAQQRRARRLAQLWRLERRRQRAMATRVQRCWRRRVALRRALATLLAAARKREETALFCRQSLRACTQHLADELVFASLHRGFEESVRALVAPPSRAAPPPRGLCFPILQLVFLTAASGAKDPIKSDERALLQTRLERSRVVALFKAVNKQQQQQQPVAKKPKPLFSMTDVDVALAKAGGASKRALTFDEFARLLRLLAELKLGARVRVWWSRFEGSDAQLLALLWDVVLVLPDMAPLAHQLSAVVRQALNERCARIQRLFQRGRRLRRGLLARLELRRQREAQARARAATLLQSRMRVLLARQQLKQRVQAAYDKYVDPDWGLPYWTNPATGYATWAKPRVLRADDVRAEAVPFPPPRLTLKLACDGQPACARCAEWLCYDCDKRFCGACLPEFHRDKRGGREDGGRADGDDDDDDDDAKAAKRKSEHAMEEIALCGLCQFQVAARRCLSCLPSAAATRSSGAECREALFCDVCFGFLHRRGALAAHKSVALLETCGACASTGDDDDLDAASSSAPSRLPHAVQWECEHCETHRRVCGRCVATRHPPELCGGEPKRVPLQTRVTLARAQRIATESEARDRADVEKTRLRSLQAKRERCALRLQKFWRARVPVVRARRVVAQLTQAKRARWQQLQVDAKRETQFVYLARNFLGLAKPLATDSAVRRKLRAMNALQRRQLAIRARMFGLLAHEYMRVGVPLPGVGRAVGGALALDTTEDLRGWVKTRQTLRLKRVTVDSSMKRERALENLSSWHHLAVWDHQSGGGGDELLVDVATKEAVTERRIPLAQPLGTREAEGDDGAEDEHVFVMFLVEYSMDPARVVWINHSLAERFWAWKRSKTLERQERQREANERKTLAAAVSKEEIRESRAASVPVADRTENADVAAEEAPAEAACADYEYTSFPDGDAGAVGATEYDSAAPYANPENGYGYSEYDYSSYYAAGAAYATDAAAPLVNSSGYFSAADGNASAWQGYEYDAASYQHAPYDYGGSNEGYSTGDDAAAYDANDAAVVGYESSDALAWSEYAQAQQPADAYSTATRGYSSAYDYSTSGYADGTYTADPDSSSYTEADGYTGADGYIVGGDDGSTWEEVFDPQSSQTYYVNSVTGESVWQLPAT